MDIARWFRTGSLSLVLVVAGAAAPLCRADDPVAVAAAPARADWSTRVWLTARGGDQDRLMELLDEGADLSPRLAANVALLKTNIEAREAKRQSQQEKVSAELDQILAGEGDDISLSLALKSAVELHMLATDKEAVLADPRIEQLAHDAQQAAGAAEQRGDWLTASDLYARLNNLFEEQGTFKDDIQREMQRLAMIRLYAPERFWELRNTNRNAQIAWKAAHKDINTDPDDERALTSEADAKARREAATRPLPPYNPIGDDFRAKLAGIEENMVLQALNRAYRQHVERKGMDEILVGAIGSVRTLVTTDDLRATFPGLAADEARGEFLQFLDREEAKVLRSGAGAGTSDMLSLVQRLIDRNEKTVRLPKFALMHEFGNGAMLALDEFSAIIWPDEIRRFNRNTQGRFVGVGIQIELDPLWNIRVVTPLEGTPAQRAGVRPGDLIRKVDGQSTEGFTLDQAVDVITGPSDTRVVLTVEREDGDGRLELELPLRREEIKVDTVKGWRKTGPKVGDWDWFIDPASQIGYVRLTQFADRTDEDLDLAIDEMKADGLSGLIVDLRFNPGGLLEQAVSVTSRFIDRSTVRSNDGMVVTTHSKDNGLVQQEPALAGKARLKGIPVVVLINEGSASASEIVSGALQDYARSGDARVVILGARSYGKGSVQNVWSMDGRAMQAAVKVTTQYYHLPAGRKIHRLPASEIWGVDPDLRIEMLPMQNADAFMLRQSADVLKIGEGGAVADAAGKDGPADPEDLINKGMDLQLQTALVLLQSQAEGAGRTVAGNPRAANN